MVRRNAGGKCRRAPGPGNRSHCSHKSRYGLPAGGPIITGRKHFRRALEIDLEYAEGYRPDNYVALDYDNLSTLFLSMGMPDSALVAAQEALYWAIESFDPKELSDNPSLDDLAGTNQLDVLTYLLDKARAHRALGGAKLDAGQYQAALVTSDSPMSC
jgi:tetratricopeptide (TPR) repeat protein